MFLSHCEFNMNSINTDEAIFMEMILAPDVALEMARNQRMRGPNLLERLNCLNKENIINTMKHLMMMVLYNYVAKKTIFCWKMTRGCGCRTWSCFLQFWSRSHK